MLGRIPSLLIPAQWQNQDRLNRHLTGRKIRSGGNANSGSSRTNNAIHATGKPGKPHGRKYHGKHAQHGDSRIANDK